MLPIVVINYCFCVFVRCRRVGQRPRKEVDYVPYATPILLHLFPSKRTSQRNGSDHTTGPRLSDCRTDFG